uniref:gliding motility-associated C-terminal domain-containing protein n=1 Tax=Tamlana flava TaxID=3158572 RepID=UPI00351B2A88
TDECGLETVHTQTITVQDTTAPTFVEALPADATVECDAVPTAETLTATDNCGTATVTFNEVRTDGDCPSSYSLARTWTATDECGLETVHTQTITVQDTTAPTFVEALPADATAECDAIPAAGTLTATDNCGSATVTFGETRTDGDCPSNYTLERTWTATDECGLTTTHTQTITVEDTTPPTGTAPSDASYQCISQVPQADPNSIADEADNCSTPVVAFVSDVSTTNSCSEVIARTFSITDDCGNKTLLTQTITVEDTISPTASVPNPIQVECIDDVPSPNINIITDAQDNCSKPVVSFISDVSNSQSCPETIIRTYRVSDACDNFIDIKQQITIQDNTPPTASNPATTHLNSNDVVPAQDPTIVIDETDNCGIPKVAFVSETASQNACEEVLTRTYRVTDACGNAINVIHKIVITDNVSPTTSNLAPLQLNCNDNIPEPDIRLITDATDNFTTPTVVFLSDVSDNQSCPETIIRTYRVSDACGNFTDVTQSIIIHDTIPPTASSPQNTVVTDTNSVPKPDPLVVNNEADNCGIPVVTFIDEISNNEVCNEIITRTYRVTDACGNYIDVSHTIEIKDNVPPTGNNPTDTIVSCINDVPIIDPNVVTIVSDNNGAFTVDFLSEDTSTKDCNDVITRVYRITDICGNYTDVNHNIFIIDDLMPQMDNDLESEIYLNCAMEPTPPAVTFSDNCTTSVSVTFNEEKFVIDDENYDIKRTWTATDECNNSNSFEQVIHMSSHNEATTTALNVCISDSVFDLNDLVNTTDNGSWSGSDITVLDGTIFNPDTIPEGNYSFYYTVTTNACKQIDQFDINVNDDCVVYSCIKSTSDVDISKIITPNNDLRNDTFNVVYRLNEAIDDLSTCDIRIKVQLYNRWGTKVFESNDYDNRWQGNAPKGSYGNAEKLPTGTYYYIVDLKNSGLKPIQGYIYLGTK